MLILSYLLARKQVSIGDYSISKDGEKWKVINKDAHELIEVDFKNEVVNNFKINLIEAEIKIITTFIKMLKWFRHFELTFEDTWKLSTNGLSVTITDRVLESCKESFD